MICLRRLFSSLDLIFVLTETLSWNGMSTMNLPGRERSHVSRGPLVLMGSLAICTRISCPTVRASTTVSSLLMSGSRLKCSSGM